MQALIKSAQSSYQVDPQSGKSQKAKGKASRLGSIGLGVAHGLRVSPRLCRTSFEQKSDDIASEMGAELYHHVIQNWRCLEVVLLEVVVV